MGIAYGIPLSFSDQDNLTQSVTFLYPAEHYIVRSSEGQHGHSLKLRQSVYSASKPSADAKGMGYVILDMLKSEKVELKSGVMTWDGETLEKLCATARVFVDKETGIVTVKVGGLGNQNSKRYIICFEHYSHLLRVVIVGKNTNGFSITFEQEKATVIDSVFRAEALDNDGTLLIIQDFRKAIF